MSLLLRVLNLLYRRAFTGEEFRKRDEIDAGVGGDGINDNYLNIHNLISFARLLSAKRRHPLLFLVALITNKCHPLPFLVALPTEFHHFWWHFKADKRYSALFLVANSATQLLDFEENLNMSWHLQLNLTVPHLLLSPLEMSDNLKDKVSQLGERLKIGGSGVGQKISAGMSSISFKMKELFQGGNQIDKLVEEATTETLDGPDWATNLEIYDMINRDRMIVKNCERAFAEVAAEKSLKTRGIKFPGRDNDRLAPIFTPQRSPNATLAQQLHREIPT
ncbi:hypothetical protein PHJA_000686900 [Phtheirospermum japonicum]|uniref:VHS domain-containing protein n=1 Tax=Phtheirospermum japonicum TaxID=374723 RepID=A0A830BGZ7_9LAMI|nr:hypothetical protein PHJA_000686900 [Phtheirospermum japonicum]